MCIPVWSIVMADLRLSQIQSKLNLSPPMCVPRNDKVRSWCMKNIGDLMQVNCMMSGALFYTCSSRRFLAHLPDAWERAVSMVNPCWCNEPWFEGWLVNVGDVARSDAGCFSISFWIWGVAVQHPQHGGVFWTNLQQRSKPKTNAADVRGLSLTVNASVEWSHPLRSPRCLSSGLWLWQCYRLSSWASTGRCCWGTAGVLCRWCEPTGAGDMSSSVHAIWINLNNQFESILTIGSIDR